MRQELRDKINAANDEHNLADGYRIVMVVTQATKMMLLSNEPKNALTKK